MQVAKTGESMNGEKEKGEEHGDRVMEQRKSEVTARRRKSGKFNWKTKKLERDNRLPSF